MMARGNGSRKLSAFELHREWLGLVDTDGPFVAAPVLAKVFNNGIGSVFTGGSSAYDAFKDAHGAFMGAWDRFDRIPEHMVDESQVEAFVQARDAWVVKLLADVLGWASELRAYQPGSSAFSAESPDGRVRVEADGALWAEGADQPAVLIMRVPAVKYLRDAPGDSWSADYIDRLDVLLRKHGVQLGLVTDGRWWGLVSASAGTMTASGVFDAFTWVEEKATRDAFLTLLTPRYVVGGNPEQRLAQLFADSVTAAEEVTEALGAQVRRAVELLIQAFSEADIRSRSEGRGAVLPADTDTVYEAAVTVMMRVVFLLFAEERGLLPRGVLFEQGYGIAGELDGLQKRQANESEEVLDATSLTWHRLLATSQALFRGSSFEDIRMPAYGGSLFDPERFEFLTARHETGSLKLTVSDRVMLHVLDSVQVAVIKKEARRISFRDIDVEQIGYIYEGLLGFTATRVEKVTLGLGGAEGSEPEITLEALDELSAKISVKDSPKAFAQALRDYLKGDQPSAKAQTATQIAKLLGSEPEPSAVSALSQLVGRDSAEFERILPWLPIVRLDLRARPFVVPAGGLLVVETPSRKNAGAHYTPKSLAEEVVLHALEPLCYSPGPYQTNNRDEFRLKGSTEILNLKVADIACGSGAFLVAAARYLADRVAEAWVAENPAMEGQKNLPQRAMREVVARCLYGADINSMAVEMCKLSLWLVSLDPAQPFSFVDDKIFVGNSLLGVTDLKQISRAHIDSSSGDAQSLFNVFEADSKIQQAIALRRELATKVNENDPMRSTAAKMGQLACYRQVTSELRTMADGVIAAGLELGGKPGKKLDEAYENLRVALKQAFDPAPGEEPSFEMLEAMIDRGLTPTVETDYERWQPLHWVLEAPDVLVEHGGFDAIVGNPPFLGSQKLKGAMGANMRDWFVEQIGYGAKGIADFVAYFFLRAQALVNRQGTLGLIATNTVAQGDTREVGLHQMLENGFTITHAVQSKKWPSASASLEYAAVWGSHQEIPQSIPRMIEGLPVKSISSLLEPQGLVEGDPLSLEENSGLAFNGMYVLGMGFTLETEEAFRWIAEEPQLEEVVRPYLGGKDLNNRPDFSASRYVIDFNERTEEQAREYWRAYKQVEELVKPERQRTKPNGEYVLRRPMPEKWWQYAEKRPALRKAIADKDRVIAIAQVSSTLMPAFVIPDQVLDAMLIVFALDDDHSFAVLSSDIHRFWALQHGTTMRTDARYTPSSVFIPFPRPASTEATEHWGRVLDTERRDIMLRRQLGLTKLYNLVNDPELADSADTDAARLREIHRNLDAAVAAAYGWEDINLDHGFYTYKQVTRYSISPAARVEVLDRLLAENHRRAKLEAEVAESTATKAKKPVKATKTVEAKQKESLF